MTSPSQSGTPVQVARTPHQEQLPRSTSRHVLIAGGTTGINLGFARTGDKVFVFSRKQAKVDAAVASLKALGAQAAPA